MTDEKSNKLIERIVEVMMPAPSLLMSENPGRYADALELFRDADEITLLRAAKIAEQRIAEMEPDPSHVPFPEEMTSPYPMMIKMTRLNKELSHALMTALIQQLRIKEQERLQEPLRANTETDKL